MARFLNLLRQEVVATVQDFREKGAAGTLRDAALNVRDLASDARDLASDAGGWLLSAGDETPLTAGPYISAAGAVAIGDVVELRLAENDNTNMTVSARVLAVDLISKPPRGQVQRLDNQEVVVAPILEAAAAAEEATSEEGAAESREVAADDVAPQPQADSASSSSASASSSTAGARAGGYGGSDASTAPGVDGAGAAPLGVGNLGARLAAGLRSEWQDTVEDFREKGAVGAFRDAALDTVDILHGVVGNAVTAIATATKPPSLDQEEQQEQESPAAGLVAADPFLSPAAPAGAEGAEPHFRGAAAPVALGPSTAQAPSGAAAAAATTEEAEEEFID